MRRHRWQPRPAQSSKQSRAMSCHSVLQSTVRLPEPQSLQYQGRLSLSVSLWWGNITREDITHLGSHSPTSSRDGREKLITLITAALGASVWQPNEIQISQLKLSLEFARTEIPVLSDVIFILVFWHLVLTCIIFPAARLHSSLQNPHNPSV